MRVSGRAAGFLVGAAEAALGPVDNLVNNATGWVQDTFTPDVEDRFGRQLRPVSAATFGQQFAVDAMAAACSSASWPAGRPRVARPGAGSSG